MIDYMMLRLIILYFTFFLDINFNKYVKHIKVRSQVKKLFNLLEQLKKKILELINKKPFKFNKKTRKKN